MCILQREAQPAHFFLGAAHAAVERRRAAQRARELRPMGAAAAAPAVVPGAYVGQYLAADGLRRLSEEEFLHFLEVTTPLNCLFSSQKYCTAGARSDPVFQLQKKAALLGSTLGLWHLFKEEFLHCLEVLWVRICLL